jgi:hypothetical protein
MLRKGTLSYVVGILACRTERKKTERKLHENGGLSQFQRQQTKYGHLNLFLYYFLQ